MGEAHSAAATEKIAHADLDGERLLLYCKSDYPSYWAGVTGYFKSRKINAKVAGEYDGITSLTTALEGGLGLALVAATTRFSESARVTTRPLADPPPNLVVAAGLATASGDAKWASAFADELRRAVSA